MIPEIYLQQLTHDLSHYYVGDVAKLTIDFSNTCGEGHVVKLDGVTIEDQSDIKILDENSNEIGNGWFDFIEDAETHKVYFFWLFLSGTGIKNKSDCTIPDHLWNTLSQKTRNLLGNPNYSSADVNNYYSNLHA